MVATFRFEQPTAPINWPRIANTNVLQLARLGDVEALRQFLADVAVGDAEDGYVAYDHAAHLKAFKVEQLMSQYLLHSQHVMAKQKTAFDQGARRHAQKEQRAKKKAHARRERLRQLEEECAKQDRILATYHAMLQKVDPETADRLAQDKQGRIILMPEDDLDDDDTTFGSLDLGGSSRRFSDLEESARYDDDDVGSEEVPYYSSDDDEAPPSRNKLNATDPLPAGGLPFKRTLHTLQWSRSKQQTPQRDSLSSSSSQPPSRQGGGGGSRLSQTTI